MCCWRLCFSQYIVDINLSLQIDARDADIEDNAVVRYELVDEKPGSKMREMHSSKRAQRFRSRNRGDNPTFLSDQRETMKRIFSLHRVTGEIKIIGSLDSLEETYHLTVSAYDAGTSHQLAIKRCTFYIHWKLYIKLISNAYTVGIT